MTKQKKRAARKDKSYLVATFANFPGVEIPLLSDEECQARGINKPGHTASRPPDAGRATQDAESTHRPAGERRLYATFATASSAPRTMPDSIGGTDIGAPYWRVLTVRSLSRQLHRAAAADSSRKSPRTHDKCSKTQTGGLASIGHGVTSFSPSRPSVAHSSDGCRSSTPRVALRSRVRCRASL